MDPTNKKDVRAFTGHMALPLSVIGALVALVVIRLFRGRPTSHDDD
jgi:hypothetical protein